MLPRVHAALEAVGADLDDSDDGRLAADLTALFALVAELADSAATYLRELDAEVNELYRQGEHDSADAKGRTPGRPQH